jgi:DNA-binding YbaB/EbfC family protein
MLALILFQNQVRFSGKYDLFCQKIKAMFDKLGAAKEMAESVKVKLETITVMGEAGSGKVKVSANGNRKIQGVQISDDLLNPENKEELEDLLTVAINRALATAENVSESEMRAMMSTMMPGLGNLFGK